MVVTTKTRGETTAKETKTPWEERGEGEGGVGDRQLLLSRVASLMRPRRCICLPSTEFHKPPPARASLKTPFPLSSPPTLTLTAHLKLARLAHIRVVDLPGSHGYAGVGRTGALDGCEEGATAGEGVGGEGGAGH